MNKSTRDINNTLWWIFSDTMTIFIIINILFSDGNPIIGAITSVIALVTSILTIIFAIKTLKI